MFTCVNALNAVAVRSNKMLDAERGCRTVGCLSRTSGVPVTPTCEFERTPGCNRQERHRRKNRFREDWSGPLQNRLFGNQHELQADRVKLLFNGGFDRFSQAFYGTAPDPVAICVHNRRTSMHAVPDSWYGKQSVSSICCLSGDLDWILKVTHSVPIVVTITLTGLCRLAAVMQCEAGSSCPSESNDSFGR